MSHARAIRQVVDEAVLADSIGVDVIALGEHHRSEYAISSPETVLAGIATQTSRIRLASGVTVLSSDDPVRVFQRFATVDALSNGRAEVILGRGSFTESFPLFGYDLRDYNVLFEEKIDSKYSLTITNGNCGTWQSSSLDYRGRKQTDRGSECFDAFAGTDFGGFFFVATKEKGGWYVSPVETIVQYVRYALEAELAK